MNIPNTDKEFYLAYFGKAKDHYWEKASRYQNNFVLTFNFWGLLFPSLWFVYRKLYVEFLFSLLFFGIINYIFSGLYLFVIQLIVRLGLLCLADKLYINKASRIVNQAKINYNTRQNRIDFLVHKGGVSRSNVEIFIIVSILLSIIYASIKVFKVI